MLRRLCSYKRVQLEDRAHYYFLKHDPRADERELREFARANLAHFKAPHSVRFVKELPKTATGKIQKYIIHFKSATACAGSACDVTIQRLTTHVRDSANV